MRRVWLLNLDAERELSASHGYETPKRLREQIARETPRLRALLCPQEPVWPEGESDEVSNDRDSFVLVPWCPTPNALRLAQHAGLRAARAPSVDVLRLVNHRRFALEVAPHAELARASALLPELARASLAFDDARHFVEPASPQAADLAWLERPTLGSGFRLKRSYGFAGKGQRRIVAGLTEDDRRWIREALAQGGFFVEPEVTLTRELSVHGYVDERSALFGRPCELVCDRFGAPVSVARAEPASLGPLAEALSLAASALAEALRARGYFGAFGLDTRLFDSELGPGITLLGDVNARFTLGWSIGLGAEREAALARLTSAHS